MAVKVALLDDSLADPLRQGLGRLKDLRLGSHRYCVEDSPVLAKATSWSELALQPASSSANEPEWELHFSTPIIFRSGRKTVAPSPGLVLGHYRAVWTEFSQVPIPALNFGERLSAGFIGSTVPVGGEVGWGRTTGTGFIGSASLRVADPDAETVAIISALTALAPFCGTGSSTTFGCGVTDLVG